jgi:nucleoside-diphosphate-sugar epimerase
MVGPRVVDRLGSYGFRVRVLAATKRDRYPFAPEVDVRIGDVADPETARSAVEGVDVIVHMAALLHATEGASPDVEAYRRTNVEGTRQMVNAALSANVGRFVLFSTIAVYGPGHGDPWDESSPLCPDSPYGITKAEAERIVIGATRRDGTPLGVVLRLAAVFGPNLKGNYLRLARALGAGRFVPLGAGTNRRALINDRDVAAATLLAATHPAAAGRTYNLSDGIDYPLADVIGAMCHALGRQPPRVRLPLPPVRWAAGVVEAMARVAGVRPPVTRAAIEKYTEDTRVDSSLIRKDLGFVPQSSLREGWMDAISSMRQSGQL